MSDSSSVQLYYVPETVWGETPAAALREFRFTSESLGQTTETTNSNEIRSDRMVADIVRTRIGAGGDVGIELSYGAHDDLLEGALASTWGSVVNFTGTVSFATDSPNRTGTLTITGSPEGFKNARVGQFVRVTSGVHAGFYRITQKVSNLVLRVATPSAAFTTTSYATTVKGSCLTNGVERKSFTVEKLFSDLSPQQRMILRGMRVGQSTLSIAPGSIIAGGFTFLGKSAIAQTATVGTGGPTAAATNDVMNAVDNITDILIDGATQAGVYFTQVDLEVNNNLREQPAIASLTNVGIGLGRTVITGTIAAYFQNRTLLDKYLAYTALALSYRAVDAAGNSYVFYFPSVRLTTGEVVAGGNDQDVLVNVGFSARRDPTTGVMLALSRIAA